MFTANVPIADVDGTVITIVTEVCFFRTAGAIEAGRSASASLRAAEGSIG
jgi:hypothetical protein